MPPLPTSSRPWFDPQSQTCPVGRTLRLLGGKYGPSTLHCLMGGEMHFLELTRALEGISRKVLAAQLRDFEREGLVRRVQKHDARRRVGYSLTQKGAGLAAILDQIYDWSQEHPVQSG